MTEHKSHTQGFATHILREVKTTKCKIKSYSTLSPTTEKDTTSHHFNQVPEALAR